MATIRETVHWKGDANRVRCHFVVNPFGVISHICENVDGDNERKNLDGNVFHTSVKASPIRVREYLVTMKNGMGTPSYMMVCNKCVAKNKSLFNFRPTDLKRQAPATREYFFVRKENGEKVAILDSAIGILDSRKEIVNPEDLGRYVGKYIFVVYSSSEDNDEGILCR